VKLAKEAAAEHPARMARRLLNRIAAGIAAAALAGALGGACLSVPIVVRAGPGSFVELAGSALYAAVVGAYTGAIAGAVPGALVMLLTRAKFAPWRSIPRLAAGATGGLVLAVLPFWFVPANGTVSVLILVAAIAGPTAGALAATRFLPGPRSYRVEAPSLALAPSFEAMRDAVVRADGDAWPGRKAQAHADVPAFVATLNRRARGEDVPEGWVPESTFWIVESGRVVGELEIRRELNDWLAQIGGHIGYLTHPAHRNRGVATFALREGLKIVAGMGVRQALATCRDDNAASIRVIEKCGGVRLEDSTIGPPLRRRYAFEVSPKA
jgi:predicted acetyltransferase